MDLYAQRASNLRRTWALIAGFLVVVIAIGYAVAWYYQNPGILYIATVFALSTNVYAYWFSDRLVLSMSHARPAKREEYFDFYTVTENLAIAAGMPKPKLYVINDPAPNAFATGRDEKHGVVCATTGLLAMLDRSELEGVIAHELSHIKNRDILVMTVAVVLAGFVAIVADLFLRMAFYSNSDRDRHPAVLILGVVGIILAPLAAQLIQLAISRRREYLADASGALLTRYPEGLASALQKISAHNVPMQHKSHATAHLFIDEPFGKPEGKGKLSWIEGLFATHPPVEERIKALLSNRR